jgi:HD-GYP domain-containing protein (c-di-GMP phosphodiesterase class II)
MPQPRIVLGGLGVKLSGLTWESNKNLRIGRQTALDVILRDHSVERIHADVRYHGTRWIIRDLARSPLYPTWVNDVQLGGRDQVLQKGDTLQIGKLQLRVLELIADAHSDPTQTPPRFAAADLVDTQQCLQTSGMQMLLKARTKQSWDKALETVAVDGPALPHQDKAMLALVRANHHMSHLAHFDDLLRSILVDTVGALNANRGCIILGNNETGELQLRATYNAIQGGGPQVRPFSKTLARRCFGGGESLLCDNVDTEETLAMGRSVRSSALASVICALLRTPRKRIGVLHLDRGILDEPFSENELYYADAIAASVAVGIETALLVEHQRQQCIQTVTSVARAADARNQYGEEHTRRITDFSLMLAEELNLSAGERYQIRVGTPLHDIGKIGIADDILRKPGKLTDDEFETMKSHTTLGASMLDSMLQLVPMIPIVKHHHERWDGTGYPDKLHHDQIPLTARIVSIADAFDAMTCDRPYRAALSTGQAFQELVNKAGTHFDPSCVFAFMRLRQKIEERLAAQAQG